MGPNSRQSLVCRGLAALATLVAFLAPLQAQAESLGPITVSLIAPGGVISDPTALSFEQVVVNPISGIAAGDGGEIGNFMLPGEEIRFEGQSILLHVAAGGESNGGLVTGFLGLAGDPARYVFSGLQVPGQVIVGLEVYAFDGYGSSGMSGVLGGIGVTRSGPDSVIFRLDELVFDDRGTGSGDAYGEFRIDLVTVPVPEPSSALFMLAGLTMVGAALRRRHAAAR
jgi:hypothetical protein